MKIEEKNKEKILKITHSGEILFWLVIILIIVSFSSITSMWNEKHDENDYQIFMPDIDGLIVGSSVRMMGIEVGYVKKIEPMQDDVYIKFVITNPDVYVPQGTIATVEFSGMAGSKSLELYLPDENTYIDKTTPIISVVPPKRLHDAMGLLNEMFEKIGTIIYTTTSFGKKLDETDVRSLGGKHNPQEFKEFINYSNTFLDNSNQKATEIYNMVNHEGGLKNVRKYKK